MKYEYALQGDYGYGHGWEDVCVEDSRKEIEARKREYLEDEGGTYRIIKRRAESE